MTNLITTLLLKAAIVSLLVTNAPPWRMDSTWSTADETPCPTCGQKHHATVVDHMPILEQRWLVATNEGAPIRLLLSEKVVGEATKTNVLPVMVSPWGHYLNLQNAFTTNSFP